MSYALFLIYLLLFCWLITKNQFIKGTGLSSLVLISLFLLKVFVGCAGYLLMEKVSQNSDAYYFHSAGIIEYHLLFNDPKQYLINIFQSGYTPPYGNFFGTVNSYWNDLGGNFIAKLLSLFNILSGGNYFINVIFFNYIVFLASIGLFRVFSTIYPNKPVQISIGCFLLPSFLFYSSYSNKDGLIFTALCSIIYCCYFISINNGRKLLFTVTAIISLFVVFIMRNYVAMVILPALFAWAFCYKFKYPPLLIFILMYSIGALLFFNANILSPKINLPQNVVDRQTMFSLLPQSNTLIPLNILKPNFKSFLLNAPQAVHHVLGRPFITDFSLSIYLIPFAVEIIFYQFIFLLFVFFRKKVIGTDSFIVFLYFFVFPILLVIGFTIPILGAIIRYRSIYLPFLITPLICTISWQKVSSFFYIK